MAKYRVDGAPEPFSGRIETLEYVKQPDGTYFVTFTSAERLPRVNEIGLIFSETVKGKTVGEAIFDYGPPVAPVTREKLSDGTYQYTFVAREFVVRGNFTFPNSPPPCFVVGTSIDVVGGARPVEQVRPGDVLRLAHGGTATVSWVGRRRCENADVVRVTPGALLVGPSQDLLVSDDHMLLVDGSLVPSGLLVDDDLVRRERWDRVEFFHVEAERHVVLLANGAPVESYLDTGNRAKFANCPLSYDEAKIGQECCAEIVLAGARLDRIRHLLRASKMAATA